MIALLLLFLAEAPLPDFDRLWNYGDPAATEAKFRELLPAAVKSGDLEYLLQLKTQIARTLGLQGKFGEAHALLDSVEAGLRPERSVARVRYLLERGRVLNSGGAPGKARPFFAEAFEQGKAAGADFHAIDAAHMMGIVEPPEKQVEWHERSLELARKSADRRAQGWTGTILHNYGFTLLDLGRAEEALGRFRESLEVRKGQGKPEDIELAEWCVAHALRKLARLDEALEIQRRLEKAKAERGAPDGYVFEEIAECLLAKSDAEGAKPWFARAHEALKGDPFVEPDRLARMAKLGGKG